MVISLIDAWVRLFKVPRLVVVAVAHQLIRRLDKNALDRLWNIAWGKERGIRPKMKRQAQHGQAWNNASGAILPPDTCLCGTLLLNHLQGLYHGAQNNTATSDYRLLACVRG